MVECHLAKVEVAGPNPVSRSREVEWINIVILETSLQRGEWINIVILEASLHRGNTMFEDDESRPRTSTPSKTKYLAPWPSGKAKVCKTYTPQFKSGWCLQQRRHNRVSPFN